MQPNAGRHALNLEHRARLAALTQAARTEYRGPQRCCLCSSRTNRDDDVRIGPNRGLDWSGSRTRSLIRGRRFEGPLEIHLSEYPRLPKQNTCALRRAIDELFSQFIPSFTKAARAQAYLA